MKLKVTENGVLRACMDLLAAERIWHRRWNVGAVKNGNRFFRFGQKGDADILAIPRIGGGMLGSDLVPLWIETKRPGGKLTTEQLAFADDVRGRGHNWLLVEDVKTLQDWLTEHRAR